MSTRLCNGVCQSVKIPCNGECPPTNTVNCKGLCENSLVSTVYMCGQECKFRNETCDGQCHSGVIKINKSHKRTRLLLIRSYLCDS